MEQKCTINPASGEWKVGFCYFSISKLKVISLCILLCVVPVFFLCIWSSFSAEVSPWSLSSAVELRQAIVAMMNRKDELEEQNTYVGIYPSLSAVCKPSKTHTLTHTQTLTLRLEEDIGWPFCINCASLFSFHPETRGSFVLTWGRRQFCCGFVFRNKPPETVIYTHLTAAEMDRWANCKA